MDHIKELNKNGYLWLRYLCEKTKQPIELVVSKGRKRELCEVRQLSSYVIKQNTTLSLQSIANILGYVSHASVKRDTKIVPNLLKHNKAFREKYAHVLVAVQAHREQLIYEACNIDNEVFDWYGLLN